MRNESGKTRSLLLGRNVGAQNIATQQSKLFILPPDLNN
jgi:hypothetical protein